MAVILVYRSVNTIGASVTKIQICSKDYVHLARKYYLNNLYVLNYSCLILSPSEMIYPAFKTPQPVLKIQTPVSTFDHNSHFLWSKSEQSQEVCKFKFKILKFLQLSYSSNLL